MGDVKLNTHSHSPMEVESNRSPTVVVSTASIQRRVGIGPRPQPPAATQTAARPSRAVARTASAAAAAASSLAVMRPPYTPTRRRVLTRRALSGIPTRRRVFIQRLRIVPAASRITEQHPHECRTERHCHAITRGRYRLPCIVSDLTGML